jgi:predicted dehydrogenase
MGKVKWGVLGAGGIARRRTIPEGLLPADNADLVSLFDPVGSEEIGREFGVTACGSEQELLDSNCDAIYIATPVYLHPVQIERAAQASKHVLCEKPIGLNVDEAKRSETLCREAGVKFGVGLMMRFHACHREAQRLIDDGRIGTPVLGRTQLSCWYPPMDNAWRQDPKLAGGGSLMDMGCHCIDLLEMLLGKVESVSCMVARRVHDYASEDTATVLLRFESGAQGIVDTLFNVPDSALRNRLELYGSAGSILAEGTLGQSASGELSFCHDPQTQGYDAQQERSQGKVQTLTPQPINMYRAQIEAFSQAILDDATPPISGQDGVWSQRVMSACYTSAQSGRHINLSEVA